MARHDDTTERPDRLFTENEQGGGWPDDAWPDAPEPSWMTDPLGDGGRTSDPYAADPISDPMSDPMSDTATIPAFDLGRDTETVVVDLTGEQPVVVSEVVLDVPEVHVSPDQVVAPEAVAPVAAPQPPKPYAPIVRPDTVHEWALPPVPGTDASFTSIVTGFP